MVASYSRNDNILRKKFYQYLIPTVLMVLAMQFGSLADAIVIGNFLGENALSASSLALPIVYLVQLPGMTIASGVAIVGAGFLGKRLVSEASKAFKLSIFLAFFVSLIFVPLGLFLGDIISNWFAGNFQELAPMISQYVKVYCFQSPIIALALVLAYFLPSDNNPNLGALLFVIGNVVHIGVEIVFCLTLPHDYVMYGVAGSFGIGLIAGMVVFIPYLKSKTRAINLKTPFKGSFAFTKDILRAGSSSGLLIALSVVYCLVLNLAATSYLTSGEMPVFAMLSNISFVIDLFIIGIFQVMPSVVSSLFGEKDYFGVRAVTRRVFLIAMGVTVVLMVVSIAFPNIYLYIFGVSLDTVNSELLASPKADLDPLLVMRIYSISFLFYSLNRFFSYYYPSLMINAPVLAGNAVRVGLAGPITVYFLMMAMGVIGFSYGVIIMEGVGAITTIVWVIVGKKTKHYSGKGLLLLPYTKKNEGVVDLSIPANSNEISSIIETLQTKALELSHDEKASAILALATEEIIDNIIEYGYKRNSHARYIDVNLTRTEVGLLLRVRDDGLTFDPTAYKADEDEESKFHGIELIRKIASDFKYLRVLNTNNTIMEIKIA